MFDNWLRLFFTPADWKHNYQILSVSGREIDQEGVNIYLIGVK